MAQQVDISPEAADDPLIGRRVRDFSIVERIGRGGMGAVYRAEHLLLREPRALKVIRAELFRAVPHAVERFEREARIAVKLRHPNLVLLHDFFVEDGDHFLVMEYVVGQSLAELLRARGVLSTAEVCRIGAQCCAGLAHAHELGIVHRDLSPENVMLTPSADGPTVKIIDFGVARAALSQETTTRITDATLTRVGDFIGKPRYASPEQAGSLGPGEELDARSDLYSLGLVLYEMATGALPFRSESAVGYLALHLYQAPPAPSELHPELNVSPALERVILRCLEKDRNARYASAAELGRALEEVSRENLARLQRPQRRRAGRPLWLAGAAAGALALAAFAAWRAHERSPAAAALTQTARAEPAPAPTPAPAPAATAAPAPVPEPTPVVAPPPVVTRVPEPEPAPPPAEAAAAPAPTHKTARATPRRAPSPAPSAAFSSEDEMEAAFQAAVQFEGGHSPAEAAGNWKKFRARGPSHDWDERAKRRITELTLGGMKEFP